MNSDNILSEDAGFTGLKYVLLMFVFLILVATPMLQGTLGAVMNIMAAGLNGMAATSVMHH